MIRMTALLLPVLLLCSCTDKNVGRGDSNLTAEELSMLIGMQTFSTDVSLLKGQSLNIGTFDESGSQRSLAVFQAPEKLVDARIVLSYWKPDKSPEARYGYILPSGSNGSGTFEVPQPYTGVTTDKTPYKIGEGLAFLRFERTNTYFGYWITPEERRTP